MISPGLQRILNLGLLALCLAGAVLVGLELFQWPFLGSPPLPLAGTAAGSGPGQGPAPQAKRTTANPFAHTPAPSLPVTSAETGITVYGVVIGPEGAMVLARAGSGKIVRVRPGQSLGGFQVKEVHPDRLVLQKGDKGPLREIRWIKREPLGGRAKGPEKGGR